MGDALAFVAVRNVSWKSRENYDNSTMKWIFITVLDFNRCVRLENRQKQTHCVRVVMCLRKCG